jgi:riboflavin synthase
MFTGIVEATGNVREIKLDGTNRHIRIECPFSPELKVDQSVTHNGVCLTVTGVENGSHWVTIVKETLGKSTLQSWSEGTLINLERSMIANGRFDGHIVQGHVDQKAKVSDRKDEGGSWTFTFEYNASAGHVTVEKGSICVDGVSLTCFNTSANRFSVAIIPYTLEHTNFGRLKVGDEVNLEFDIIGKYVSRLLGTGVSRS